MNNFRAIGLMSGSSLDGLDICYCRFEEENRKWTFHDCITTTIPYSLEWKQLLQSAESMHAVEIFRLHAKYGRYIGSAVHDFIAQHKLSVDFIASHGHTIFHQPQNGFTTQIGDGGAIYATTGIKTISDFRVVDVALGGQGAPLVPVGERDLFGAYGMFLNLGGICNITIFNQDNQLKAYDISPCNMALNLLCEKYLNKSFDANGDIAATGNVNHDLLRSLQALTYFHLPAPKSLGKEFLNERYMPVIEGFDIPVSDKLCTVVQHIANEISKAVNEGALNARQASVLVTGGGAYNSFLLSLLEAQCNDTITVPEPQVVEFKEALIFAYLGVLRLQQQPNALSAVTHASHDNIGGAIWG